MKLLASQEVKAIRAENLEAVEVGGDPHRLQHVRRSRRAPRSPPGGFSWASGSQRGQVACGADGQGLGAVERRTATGPAGAAERYHPVVQRPAEAARSVRGGA